MPEILDWAQFGTTTGVAAVVAVLTQILKRYIQKIDPKWIALVLSLLLTYCYQIIYVDHFWGTFVLSALNAIISAGMSIGVFESVIKPLNSLKTESK